MSLSSSSSSSPFTIIIPPPSVPSSSSSPSSFPTHPLSRPSISVMGPVHFYDDNTSTSTCDDNNESKSTNLTISLPASIKEDEHENHKHHQTNVSTSSSSSSSSSSSTSSTTMTTATTNTSTSSSTSTMTNTNNTPDTPQNKAYNHSLLPLRSTNSISISTNQENHKNAPIKVPSSSPRLLISRPSSSPSSTVLSFPPSPYYHFTSSSFDYLSLLGSGSFGRVFRVRQRTPPHAEFALKVIVRDGRSSYRDLREAMEEEEEYRIMRLLGGGGGGIVRMREYWGSRDGFHIWGQGEGDKSKEKEKEKEKEQETKENEEKGETAGENGVISAKSFVRSSSPSTRSNIVPPVHPPSFTLSPSLSLVPPTSHSLESSSSTSSSSSSSASPLSSSSSKKHPKKVTYLLLDLLPYGHLHSLFVSRHFNARRSRRLPLPSALTRHWLAEILLSLHFIHSHFLVHRDVKTDNLMIDDNGHIILVDFGVCCPLGEGKPKLCRKIGGEGYRAPEMWIANNEVKKRWKEEEGKRKNDKGKSPSPTPLPSPPIDPSLPPTRSRRTSDVMLETTNTSLIGYTYSVDYFNFGIIARIMMTMKHPFHRRWSWYGYDHYVKCKSGKYQVKSTNTLNEVENDLCNRLLCKEREGRLGCKGGEDWQRGGGGIEEIMNHEYFKGVDWERMRRGEVEVPKEWKELGLKRMKEWGKGKKGEYKDLEDAMRKLDEEDPNEMLMAAFENV